MLFYIVIIPPGSTYCFTLGSLPICLSLRNFCCIFLSSYWSQVLKNFKHYLFRYVFYYQSDVNFLLNDNYLFLAYLSKQIFIIDFIANFSLLMLGTLLHSLVRHAIWLPDLFLKNAMTVTTSC